MSVTPWFPAAFLPQPLAPAVWPQWLPGLLTGLRNVTTGKSVYGQTLKITQMPADEAVNSLSRVLFWWLELRVSRSSKIMSGFLERGAGQSFGLHSGPGAQGTLCADNPSPVPGSCFTCL